jgi:hypothetical protein
MWNFTEQPTPDPWVDPDAEEEEEGEEEGKDVKTSETTSKKTDEYWEKELEALKQQIVNLSTRRNQPSGLTPPPAFNFATPGGSPVAVPPFISPALQDTKTGASPSIQTGNTTQPPQTPTGRFGGVDLKNFYSPIPMGSPEPVSTANFGADAKISAILDSIDIKRKLALPNYTSEEFALLDMAQARRVQRFDDRLAEMRKELEERKAVNRSDQSVNIGTSQTIRDRNEAQMAEFKRIIGEFTNLYEYNNGEVSTNTTSSNPANFTEDNGTDLSSNVTLPPFTSPVFGRNLENPQVISDSPREVKVQTELSNLDAIVVAKEEIKEQVQQIAEEKKNLDNESNQVTAELAEAEQAIELNQSALDKLEDEKIQLGIITRRLSLADDQKANQEFMDAALRTVENQAEVEREKLKKAYTKLQRAKTQFIKIRATNADLKAKEQQLLLNIASLQEQVDKESESKATLIREKQEQEARTRETADKNAKQLAILETELNAARNEIQTLQEEQLKMQTPIKPINSLLGRKPSADEVLAAQDETKRLQVRLSELEQESAKLRGENKALKLMTELMKEDVTTEGDAQPYLIASPDVSVVAPDEISMRGPVDDSFLDEWSNESPRDYMEQQRVEIPGAPESEAKVTEVRVELEDAKRQLEVIMSGDKSNNQDVVEQITEGQLEPPLEKMKADAALNIARLSAANDIVEREKAALVAQIQVVAESPQLTQVEKVGAERAFVKELVALQAQSDDLESKLAAYKEEMAKSPLSIVRTPPPRATETGEVLQPPYLLPKLQPADRLGLLEPPSTIADEKTPTRKVLEFEPQEDLTDAKPQEVLTDAKLRAAGKDIMKTYISRNTPTPKALELLPRRFPQFVKQLTATVSENRPDLTQEEVETQVARMYLYHIRYEGEVLPSNAPTLEKMKEKMFPKSRTSPVTTRGQRAIRGRKIKVVP